MPECGDDGCCAVGPWAESPFDPAERGSDDAPRAVGACSVGVFVDEPSLAHTHRDVEGFLGWLRRHGCGESYWFRDGEVGSNLYHMDHDNGVDGGGGIDSDCVFYHSGHGFTDIQEGVYRAAMGKGSAGTAAAESRDMRIGDGNCRYLFWSTCFSLRVLRGHSPIRTWGRLARGVRMMFGFETATVDSPHLGEHFGRQHGSGYSFTMAWLTASWGISDGQVPTVAACGATRDEAVHRMRHERQFRRTPVDGEWWAWCWLDQAVYRRPADTPPPGRLAAAPLERAGDHIVPAVASRCGFEPAAARLGTTGAVLLDAGRSLMIRYDGAVTMHLSRPAPGSPSPLDPGRAECAARQALLDGGFGDAGAVVLDRIVPIRGACASVQDPDATREEWWSGALVRYRQIINGLPVVSPGAGFVDMVVDSRGVVTSVTSTIRTLCDLPPQPDPAGAGVGTVAGGGPAAGIEPDRLLAGPVADRLAALAGDGGLPVTHQVVPGSTEIGYEIREDHAVPVAQCFIEVVTEGTGRKRHRITAPIHHP